jgi:hypothetical protein
LTDEERANSRKRNHGETTPTPPFAPSWRPRFSVTTALTSVQCFR